MVQEKQPSIPQLPAMAPKLPKTRLTVVEMLYHQPPEDQPTSFDDGGFTRWLESDEQPWQRTMKLNQDWQKVDTGWVEKVGMLRLRNPLPTFLDVPTDERRKEAFERIVEVGFVAKDDCPGGFEVVPCFVIRPGETMRGEPSMIERLRVRCVKGNCKLEVTAIAN